MSSMEGTAYAGTSCDLYRAQTMLCGVAEDKSVV